MQRLQVVKIDSNHCLFLVVDVDFRVFHLVVESENLISSGAVVLFVVYEKRVTIWD